MGSNSAGSEHAAAGILRVNPGGRQRSRLRWLPAVVVSGVIAVAVLAGSIPARAGDPLPDKTPAQVMALMSGHRTHAFSGTVEQSSDLGLPEPPPARPTSGPVSSGGAASMVELLSGDRTARVYAGGKDRVRIQVLDRLAERDVIRNGSDVWIYSSKDNSTSHLSLPHHASDLPLPLPEPVPSPLHHPMPATPEEIAAHFLAKADATTAISVGADVQVAGRSAYNLVLEPRTEATLVGRVAVAVDGETGLPLSVQVTARGTAEPSFRAGFTSLSLEAPDDSLFSFVPPPGSAVEELRPAHMMRQHPESPAGGNRAAARPAVTGSGWESVVEIPAAAVPGGASLDGLLQDPLVAQALVAVPGGRLLTTTLFTVLVTDDGRVLAGMVPEGSLQTAASAP